MKSKFAIITIILFSFCMGCFAQGNHGTTGGGGMGINLDKDSCAELEAKLMKYEGAFVRKHKRKFKSYEDFTVLINTLNQQIDFKVLEKGQFDVDYVPDCECDYKPLLIALGKVYSNEKVSKKCPEVMKARVLNLKEMKRIVDEKSNR